MEGRMEGLTDGWIGRWMDAWAYFINEWQVFPVYPELYVMVSSA